MPPDVAIINSTSLNSPSTSAIITNLHLRLNKRATTKLGGAIKEQGDVPQDPKFMLMRKSYGGCVEPSQDHCRGKATNNVYR